MNPLIYDNLSYGNDGTLYIGGVSAKELAERYGTPLFVCDEDRIRENCRIYTRELEKLGNGSRALYASKALAFRQIYPVIASEGLGADVVSGGELYTAMAGGFDPSLMYFHGSNKSDEELRYAVDAGIGCVVLNDVNEAIRLDKIAVGAGRTQKVMLRVTPDIDPHTFKQVTTGKLDSKFGVSIAGDAAVNTIQSISALKNLDFCGCHCHIGSQIFETQPFLDALDVMLDLYAALASRGIACRELDLGGGIGVAYSPEDTPPDISRTVRAVVERLVAGCSERSVELPVLLLEPGRSIVANAGVTLYTVGGVKKIPGVRTYVGIDGGMNDNPRFALYGAHHTPVKATNAGTNEQAVVTVAGKTCESGDIVAQDVTMELPEVGDLVAVLTTGAYNYSMASNYNRIPRPAVVMVSGGKSRLVVRRETYEDLVRCDV